MDTITLVRTGNRPLRFQGEMLSSCNTKAHSGPGDTRWWEMAIYRTQAGGYVVHIAYDSNWQGETCRYDVYPCADAAAVAAAFRDHDHLSAIHGYYNAGERQERLLRQLTDIYLAHVTDLLDGANIEPEYLA